MVGGFEELGFAGEGDVAGAGEEAGLLLLRHGFEGAGGFEGLVEDGGFIDAGDDDGDGLGEAVVEGLDGLEGVGFEDEVVAKGFHGEDAGAGFLGDGNDFLGEGAEVGVHDVDGHLDGVEVEVVLGGGFEHAEVDGGVLVAGEADVADLAGLAGGDGGVEGSVVERRCGRGLRGG